MTSATLENPQTAPAEAQAAAPVAPAVLPLGEQLVRAGILTPNELETALNQQNAKKLRLGETLVELGFIEEEQLLPFVEKQIGVPSTRLRDGVIDPCVVQVIPRQTADALNVVALFKVRDTLTVAMAEPDNLMQLDEIERVTGLRVKPVLALKSAIQRMLPRVYEENFEVDAVTADVEHEAIELQAEAISVDLQDVGSMADGSPIVNLVNYILVHAVRQGASDIHIEAGRRHSTVRFRVDGQLREVLRPRRDFHPAIVSRLKVMAKMDIAEHRIPQDGGLHVVVEKREIDMRVSTLPTVQGEKVVLRILDRSNVTFKLDELGIPGPLLTDLKSMLAKPYGLMLVTGPTGSGKTTTLYSALELVKSVHRNIVTVEDPVEYQLELINQVHVNKAVSLNFASVLRSILRQDPDVIMIGEIRDAETAEVAIQAALTGHLVLSTLHTNDSAGAITRLLDMGIASFKISAALVGVVAQRLVRTICPKCRTYHYPTAELLESIKYKGDRRRQFIYGEGCNACHDTGYKGRIGVYEVMPANEELRELIVKSPNVSTFRNWHRERGGTNLLDEGIRMAEEGLTSLDEVTRVAGAD